MSDSSIALKPVIDEPSKPIPSLSAPSISLGVIANDFRCPSRSVNQNRTCSTPSSLIRFSTARRAGMLDVARSLLCTGAVRRVVAAALLRGLAISTWSSPLPESIHIPRVDHRTRSTAESARGSGCPGDARCYRSARSRPAASCLTQAGRRRYKVRQDAAHGRREAMRPQDSREPWGLFSLSAKG